MTDKKRAHDNKQEDLRKEDELMLAEKDKKEIVKKTDLDKVLQSMKDTKKKHAKLMNKLAK